MPDDQKPDPIEDVRKGLGLLFRAARTTIEKLPTRDLEQAVVATAREVGRAIENVGKTIERDVFGGKPQPPPGPTVVEVQVTRPEDQHPEEPKPGEPAPEQARPDEPRPPETGS
jgi:hypothetical protein